MKRPQIPQVLDIATYVSVTTMSLLGMSGLPGLRLKLMALGLVLVFALLYRFVFRSGRYEQNPGLYFATQIAVVALLFLLGSDNNDAFNFLFLMLCIHIAVVSPLWIATFWIAMCYGVVATITLVTYGAGGLYGVVFYAITFVVSGFFGYVLQQAEVARDRNQRLVDELQGTQQKLQDLAILEERNRLARDLHDSVKQQVFAISMQLSAARTALSETDKAYSSVLEAERLAQQAGSELTTLIQQLRPPRLERKTLADALQELVNEFSRQNHMEATTEIDPTIAVNLQTEQVLFRVLQEALANVARHSKADTVTVRLESENGAVTLSIEDDGIGFDARRVSKGIGLDSMQERLIEVNGKVDVISERSKGTRVIAKVRRS